MLSCSDSGESREILPKCQHNSLRLSADTDLEAEVDPSVETEEKLRAEEQAARHRLEAMQRFALPTSPAKYQQANT